ncbi:carbonic anhydrase [Dyella amyloliquefaciens]|uniref:carbonic anhydrase n=1 Tax=Dyella amyloliquefaciens TaxID=1770545 RepID=UPI00102E6F3C|nr:carbonic anhydrase family protein [Dyella amyloliquefaciens]
MQTSKRHVAGIAAVVVTLASVGALALPLAADNEATPPHWSYSGESGPAHWSTLDAKFAACGNGMAQSPIDLESHDAKPGKAGEFHIDYEKGDVALVNNGHTVQANVADAKDTVVFDGDTYHLAQFHFHSPSEHTTDQKRFPLEIHFVNQDGAKHILVVGVMVKLGDENPTLAPVFRSLPPASSRASVTAAAPIPVDLASVLPKNHEAYVYNGSLTTPPCTEGVRWVVLSHPIEMSKDQVASFSRMFPDNHRPLQKVNGREIDDDTD